MQAIINGNPASFDENFNLQILSLLKVMNKPLDDGLKLEASLPPEI